MQPKEANYQAPVKAEQFSPYTPACLTKPAAEHRKALRLRIQNFVHLYIRVRRANYEQLLWQLIATGCIEKNRAYAPENLRYWTVSIRVKVKTQLALGRVMEAMRIRLGIRDPGIRFCLDGFYGMRGFSDVFSNPNACPWMEVSNFSTALSLQLQDADSIFISVANATQIQDVQERRKQLQRSVL